MELMKSNKIALFAILFLSCTNTSNQSKMKNEKSIDNLESCKKYMEYYEKYIEEIEMVKNDENLNLSDRDIIALAITHFTIPKDTLLQVLAKNSIVCDREKIIKYSLMVEDKNGKVTDSIVEITNAHQYESIFFRGKENLNRKVLPPKIR